MGPENRSFPVPEKSFLDVLDSACGRLQEKQADYSIKHLQKLDAILCELETELDAVCESMNHKRY